MSQKKTKVRNSKIHGRGLFASRDIKKGELIGEFKGIWDDESNEIHTLWVEQNNGSFRPLHTTNSIKYANHSNKPNAEVYGTKMYAIKNIKENDEITFNYGDEWE